MKSLSGGMPTNGCDVSIRRSIVVPDRGLPSTNTGSIGREERSAIRQQSLIDFNDLCRDTVPRIIIDRIGRRAFAEIRPSAAEQLGQRRRHCFRRIGCEPGQIASLVAEIQAETKSTIDATEEGAVEVAQGARLARDVVDALERISGMVDETTVAAREISLATQQQRSASDHVVAAMNQVSDASRQYADGSRQGAASAAQLGALADELGTAISRFRTA